MRVFVLKEIAREFRKEKIADSVLCDAIARLGRGLIHADLGRHVFKQRVARPNEGKRGGLRTVIAYAVGQHALFMYVFAKSEKENVSSDELLEFKSFASWALSRTEKDIVLLLRSGEWREVVCDAKEEEVRK